MSINPKVDNFLKLSIIFIIVAPLAYQAARLTFGGLFNRNPETSARDSGVLQAPADPLLAQEENAPPNLPEIAEQSEALGNGRVLTHQVQSGPEDRNAAAAPEGDVRKKDDYSGTTLGRTGEGGVRSSETVASQFQARSNEGPPLKKIKFIFNKYANYSEYIYKHPDEYPNVERKLREIDDCGITIKFALAKSLGIARDNQYYAYTGPFETIADAKAELIRARSCYIVATTVISER